MGLFGRLFGNKKEASQSEEDKAIFYAQQDEKMKKATLQAQQNFKYFWRELYWEYRRIIPGLDFAMIKIPFEQTIAGQEEPIVEHMWINNIDFDGTEIKGELVNEPNELTNIAKGDRVSRKVNEISDWMFSFGGETYGGYTIQAMRSSMSDKERRKHDRTWGLDFGDFNEILVAIKQIEQPENLIEHPMSKNMGEEIRKFLKENPNEITVEDEHGLTLLHKEAIAGNQTIIEILLDLGADKSKRSSAGNTALEYSQNMNWENLEELLS